MDGSASDGSATDGSAAGSRAADGSVADSRAGAAFALTRGGMGWAGPGRHDSRVRGRQGRADGVGQEESDCTRIVGGRNGLTGIMALFECVEAEQIVWDRRRAAVNGDLTAAS